MRGVLLATGRGKGRPEAEIAAALTLGTTTAQPGGRGGAWGGEAGSRLGNGPVTFSPVPWG